MLTDWQQIRSEISICKFVSTLILTFGINLSINTLIDFDSDV